MSTDIRIHPADLEALETICQVSPILVGLKKAKEVIAFPDKTLLHAGPAFIDQHISQPVLHSAAYCILFEGWAKTFEDAILMLEQNIVRLHPAQDYNAVVPLASVLSPNQYVQIIQDEYGNTSNIYAPLNEGNGPCTRVGIKDPAVLTQLTWINTVLAEAIADVFAHGMPLIPVADQALMQGDDCHGRCNAASAQFFKYIKSHSKTVLTDEVSQFLASSSGFFLNTWMAASKCLLSGAQDIPNSTIITSMGSNGIQAGIQLSGNPDYWITSVASAPHGNILPPYQEQNSLPAIGDSAVVESFGLGAMAMHYSTYQSDALGHYCPVPAVTLANKLLSIPHPLFVHSKIHIGIPARTVIQVQQGPIVSLGILDKNGLQGRIGGGIWQAPVSLFERAVAEL